MKRIQLLSIISAFMAIAILFNYDLSFAKSKFEKKDSIIVGLTTEVLSLDPQMDTGTPAENVKRHIYEGLVFADEQNKIHPCLAEKWEVSGDGLTWTFYLKKGFKFHDNTDFSALAVQKTFQRILNPSTASSNRHLYTFIDSVKVVSDFSVQIVTKEPKGNFLNLIAHGPAHPISPAAIEKWGKDISNNHSGTGP
jgi:ABC-type transport system substrate-binding protein